MKTAELTGVALDWAVAKCEGDYLAGYAVDWRNNRANKYSTNWAQGGPIIERENISITGTAFSWWCCDAGWYAHFDDGGTSLETHGDTPLIAAMRCYVASKLGDEVDVPNELTKGETA